MLAPKRSKTLHLIKHIPYFNIICSKLVLNKTLKKIKVVKKILLDVPNKVVLLRITKVHLNIKRSLH